MWMTFGRWAWKAALRFVRARITRGRRQAPPASDSTATLHTAARHPQLLTHSLFVSSGVLWTLTYIELIKRGFQDKTYGMPLPALCANIGWEFLFSFIRPHGSPQLQVNRTWFALDAVILYQALKYGPHEVRHVAPTTFYALFGAGLLGAGYGIYRISDAFDDWAGAYSAFGQNLLMSVLFIRMLRQRGSLRGQSVGVARYKLLGTALASLGYYLTDENRRRSPFLLFCYVAILLCDVIYLRMVTAQGRMIDR